MVTMKELAARLGISPTTVSHVLSGRHEEFRISARTVDRVRRAASEAGYHGSALARALRSGRSQSMALVVEDLANPFWTGVAIGAEREAERHGYTLVVSNTAGDLERERRAVRLLREGRVDGLILPPFPRIDDDLRALEKEGLPFVQLDRALAGVHAPCVRTDHALGSRMLVEHLASLGHSRVGLLVGPISIEPYRLRRDAFRAATKTLRLDAIEVPIKNPSPETGRAAAAELLARKNAPTAIYGTNVFLTVGALAAVRGLPAAHDPVQVVGFDDLPFADLLQLPVTTVAHDVDRIGAQACQALLALRAGTQPQATVLVPPKLIVRA